MKILQILQNISLMIMLLPLWLAIVVATPLTAEAEAIDNDTCLSCHEDKKDVVYDKLGGEKSAHDYAHAKLMCADCHNDVTEVPHPDNQKPAKVSCARCHTSVDREFAKSIHNELVKNGSPDLPTCTTCHGNHNIEKKSDLHSSANHLHIDDTCMKCHANKDITGRHTDLPSTEIVAQYKKSVHGRAIHLKGLIVSATCTDCHGVHNIRPKSDKTSQVYKENIPHTCQKCHVGIFRDFEQSRHGKMWKIGRTDGPVCTTCHKSHDIKAATGTSFLSSISDQCGECHKEKASLYKDTFHGKATSLGFIVAAKCSDCHTPHHNLPKSDPASSIHPNNLVATCATCHPNANANFAKYNPHLNLTSNVQSPVAYYILLFMEFLLIGTFSFFGIHTLLWLQRAIVAMLRKEVPKAHQAQQYVRRFSNVTIVTHIVIIISFLGLAATGLPLKYHHAAWAKILGNLLGGVEVARYFHRLFAVVTFGYAGFHLGYLCYKIVLKKCYSWLYGPESLAPRPKDLVDFFHNIRWFLYLGKPPQYGKWAYFEKFDYFAVFWGVPVIGLSGLLMWFPGFFTKFFPGDILNIATIIHSEEALLAAGFIFTIHFFHNHLRPENFPMDISVFTGKIPVERLMHERPEEYSLASAQNVLQQSLVEPPPADTVWKSRIFGTIALVVGLVLAMGIFIAWLIH